VAQRAAWRHRPRLKAAASPHSAASPFYERLGTWPVVNANGIDIDLGGAIVSPSVRSAMKEANEHAVEMTPLLEAAGRRVVEHAGAQAAWVTPGASTAIALTSAACMCGRDTGAMERLPDTSGLRDRVVVQRGQRNAVRAHVLRSSRSREARP
jgi:D-glucosaminate-6-phosphate ammonia-lyase